MHHAVIEEIHILWDYDSLGLSVNNEVHDALREGISYNGHRYQDKLPWKEAHEP